MRQLAAPVLRACLFALAFSVGLLAQDFKPANATNAQAFLGKWQGTFQGKVFITVYLSGDAHKLSGTMSKADIELNDAGELTKAEVNEGSNPITNATVKGSRLRITAKSDDGDEINSEIDLVGADEAELRLIVPPDVPRPKPWKLARVPKS